MITKFHEILLIPHFCCLQTFGNKIMGNFSLIIPIMVAISAFGGLSVHIMTSSRMCFVGARNGHMPAVLSHISVKSYTPLPSLAFLVRFRLDNCCTKEVA